MSVHEQFAEDLALHALGTLQGEPLASLEQHLAGCAACRRELDQLRGDMALLALSAAGPAPPQRARQRLMSAVAREPRTATAAPRRSAWNWLPWAVAAVLAFAAVYYWTDNETMRSRLATLQDQSQQQKDQLDQARLLVKTLTSPDTQRVTLVALKAPPQPQGKAFYLRDRGSLIFLANNLTALPPNKAYELWLIPTQGAPIPAGVFRPDERGNASVVNPPLPAGTEAKAFAITVEPQGGSSTPTMPIQMMGAGE